ncbi:hypothetical protein LTR91_001519 [Friedmanniomyces endolithicus]|uniref:Cercosporin MFS transporter CTB4 n=1 Tax=Friedmanniomyces endolithicus TaxID=329885 RepID=A0AAN6L2U8_9PEZI|nr:hypothetical protein LTR82_001377 [Friedmanniomyces endolithicus]KAK0923620.1 hypothetical protein LTR57_006553 [Friedmanniomyces endolithicus]KAK0977957.1 hypothetical protein LTS01_012925 [Friedmanniomyces endolithicus]KAK0991171.1 hypothetical protein LTR54_011960 [Friedmanniomyces endolithicus]KAK1013208.1 hypothetical protein LTR91_001519 [Friedmanniomyces endolithicus]
MADNRKSNRMSARASRSSANWRLSSLWSPLSIYHSEEGLGDGSPWQVEDTPLSVNVPSIEPRSFDRLGAISPTSGLTSGAYAYRVDGDDRAVRETYHRSPAPFRHDAASSLYEEDESAEDGFELEKRGPGYPDQDSTWDGVHEDGEDGALGLVHRVSSQKRFGYLQRQPSAAHSAMRKLSFDQLSSYRREGSQSRRNIRRESKVISALPALPYNLRSNSRTPVALSEGLENEKRASTRRSVLTVPPPVPARESDLVLPRSKKWATTFALGFVTFCVTFASSVFSPGTLATAQEFNVSDEVMVLGTALFVLGFAFGPIIWGPASELYGRKMPLFVGFVIFGIFQVPVAVAQNVETIFVCRFLSGFFGCAPLTVVGGALADFWAPVDRGVAVSIFSGATFLGPTMGPLVGGFLVESPGLGWRWTAWITLMASAILGTIGWFVIDESFGPVLLQHRAKKIRYATRNWAIHAPADEIELNLSAFVTKYCTKPLLMLVWEPILLLITIYISFIYGILYLFFETYPISFIQQRGWTLGQGGLPFIAVMGGVMMGGVVNFVFVRTRYVRIMKQYGRVPPEERLVPMMAGSIALPVGLFWFAWTSHPSSSPIPQIISGAPVGMGMNVIIDVYMMHNNSAIAGNTVIRSFVGAAFPMFAKYMYKSLGVQWATSVLGFVAVGLIPVPILFFVYGARIRKLSRFTPKLPPGGGPGGMGPPMGAPPPGIGAPPER